ncbi:MAG: hypothetical protein KJS92_02310 [Bacteroidetes bacterium]|nr:hypothetical protein [Bacteroidota bacterium]
MHRYPLRLLCCLLFMPLSAKAQQMALEHLAGLWRHAQCDTCGLQQPLGYIGSDYQRFYIHFDAVEYEPASKSFTVTGQTRVKEYYDYFHGRLFIDSVKLLPINEYIPYQEGFIIGHYRFYEDTASATAGWFEGRFSTFIYIDSSGAIHYNDLWDGADGNENNQFEGTWTSYRSKLSKTCNWGDYRIPNSDSLDWGASEFYPNPAYTNKGWENYRNFLLGETDELVQRAIAIEQRAWWKQAKR